MDYSARKPMALRTKIILLVAGIFLISLMVVGIVVENTMIEPYMERLGNEAMNIAKSVASIPRVIENVGIPGSAGIIQPIADGIRKKTGAEFVVVIDRNSVRYSHPVPERIGKTFVGGDEGPALKGKEYVSNSIGTLGPSLRAFVPIFREGEVAGAVSVGILMNDVNAMRWSLLRKLLFALATGLIISIVGARFLASNIKNDIRGLEPYQISRILMEREAILNSIREGIIAVDSNEKITLINESAKKLMGLDESALGEDVSIHVPNSRLPEVLKTGEIQLDQEQLIGSSRIITNRIPIKGDARIFGALASFRDMTEVTAMAEELTGVRKYVEALRVRTHEFLNKLHTISGLIQLGEYDRAVEYISGIIHAQQNLISIITKNIKNPSIGGLLLGKSGRCRELGIEFTIDENSFLGRKSKIDTNSLVTIIGNLLENSINASLPVEKEKRKIHFSIFEESGKIIVSVHDQGVGILPEEIPCIFQKGYSNSEEGQGLGLYNVNELVRTYGGEISVTSEPGSFTEFIVSLPNGGINFE